MRLVVLSVGGPRDRAIKSAVRDYEARAGRYVRLESIEVPAAAGHGGIGERARDEEASAILRRLPDDLEAWALTRTGVGLTSSDLADELQHRATYGDPGIAFVVGGAFGLADRVVEQCRRRFSLSELTLPHDLARLVLVEQLYRAGTILRGEPYHKGT
jgi:23S rRNA (pseudouridine1915-N3)-methyltransferase